MAVAPLLFSHNIWNNLEHKTSFHSIIEEFLTEIEAIRKRWFESSTLRNNGIRSTLDDFLSEFETMRNRFWSNTEFTQPKLNDSWSYRSRIDDFLSEAQELRKRKWAETESKITNDKWAETELKITNDKFQVVIDVKNFEPEEVQVKIVGDSIIVEGKHEKKQDKHGFVSRQFIRKYTVPYGHKLENMTPVLCDGVLTISVPRLAITGTERVIPVTKLPKIEKATETKSNENSNFKKIVTNYLNNSKTEAKNESKQTERVIPIERLGTTKSNIERTGNYNQKIQSNDESNKRSSIKIPTERIIPTECTERFIQVERTGNFNSKIDESNNFKRSSTTIPTERIIPIERTGNIKQSDSNTSVDSQATLAADDSIFKRSASICSVDSNATNNTVKSTHYERIIPVEQDRSVRDTVSICSLDSNATILDQSERHQNYHTSVSMCSVDEPESIHKNGANERVIPIERTGNYRSSVSICSVDSNYEQKSNN